VTLLASNPEEKRANRDLESTCAEAVEYFAEPPCLHSQEEHLDKI
jgi:hypothetical protein